MQQYYLYTSDNTVQPRNFIGNKVAGILFENKVDHTTFFDPNIEAIQGIHMIPILPPSNFARTNQFVKEEWDAFFSNGRIDKINNAWKGVAYANYATIEPRKAWDFFRSSSFQDNWLDGGASRTWYLAYAAGKCILDPGRVCSTQLTCLCSLGWCIVYGLADRCPLTILDMLFAFRTPSARLYIAVAVRPLMKWRYD